MSRSRVQFLTLSELAFTFLFALLILVVADWQKMASLAAKTADALQRATIAEAKQAELEKKLAAVRQQQPNTTKLRSPAFPACGDAPLTQLQLIAADSAEEAGTVVSLASVRLRFAELIADGLAKECRHRLIVSPSPALGADAYDQALRYLEQTFYLRRVSR